MLIKNSRHWSNHSLGSACLNSLLILVIAFLCRYLLHPLMQGYAPFHAFIVACLWIAFFYGYQLAGIAMVISTPLGAYFFMPPFNTFETPQTVDFIQYVNFWGVTAVAIFMIERLQRAMSTRDLVLKIMGSRHRAALWRENDRVHQERRARGALKTMQELSTHFERALVLGLQGEPWHVTARLLDLLKAAGHPEAPADWLEGFHPEDRPVLQRQLEDMQGPGKSPPMAVRLAARGSGSPSTVRVCVERIDLQGRWLSVWWLVDDA